MEETLSPLYGVHLVSNPMNFCFTLKIIIHYQIFQLSSKEWEEEAGLINLLMLHTVAVCCKGVVVL